MPAAKYRHFGCRIMDDLVYKGMRTVFLENDLLRVGILLDKGADLFQFLYKPLDIDFLWRSPTGLIRPDRFTATRSASGGSFLDSYHGGWQEILPGGGPFEYRGAEIGLHGEVTHLGWDCDILVDRPDEVAVLLTVSCVRTPFQLQRTLRLVRGEPSLRIEETLTNLSPEPQEFMWGHHPAFGPPFLRAGLRLFVPAGAGQVHSPRFAASGIFEPGDRFPWPHVPYGDRVYDLSCVPGEEAGFADLVYLSELAGGWYALMDPEKQLGIGMAWDKDLFPYLWFWMVYGRAPGYPWWNQVYCMALEPWTSMPNQLEGAIKAGTQAHLKGGDSLTTSLAATIITGRSSLNGISLDGTFA